MAPLLPTVKAARRNLHYPRRLYGVGMVQVMLLIAVMAGLATVGYLQWRERSVIDSSRQERRVLAQADRALVAFATVERRLPCPDTNRDGLEDCGDAVQKGWLPSVTLRLAGADPGVGVGQLRYLVQRQGGENDLTILSDSWQPLAYDASFFDMAGSDYAPSEIKTLADFCQRLDKGRTTGLTGTLARVNSSPMRSTAYALAHPGNLDADGDGDLFDGVNTMAPGNADLMEDPGYRPLLASYDDVVLERAYDGLLSALQCQPLLDSINTVALGHDLAVEVDDMKAGNIESARRAVAFAAVAAAMNALDIALVLAEGISDAGNAAVEWVGCAASLGLAVNLCAAAPQHTVASALAGGVMAADLVAVGLNAVAAGIAGTALKLADSSATPDQLCPPEDPALNNQLLASLQQEVIDANADYASVNAAIANKTTDLNAANAARTTAINTLFSSVRHGNAASSIDGKVTALLQAATGWGNASYNKDAADTKQQQASAEVVRLSAEVAKYNAMLADPAGSIATLDGEIAALEAQIAATSDPGTKEALQNQLAAKKADRNLAGSPAGLTKVRDNAVSDLAEAQATYDAAVSAYSAATSAFSTASTNYQQAYNNLVNTGRFDFYNGSGAVVGHGCTGGCQSGDVNVSGALTSALQNLFGTDSTKPGVEANYLKPMKIQKELDSLGDRREAANERRINAQNRLNELQQKIDNPPPCNVTGSAVTPMSPDQALDILIEVDRKGGTR